MAVRRLGRAVHGGDRGEGADVSLPYSILNTAAALVFPMLLVAAVDDAYGVPSPRVLVGLALGVAASLLFLAIASLVWRIHPHSDTVSFVDSLLWRALPRRARRKKTQAHIDALRLDAAGRPTTTLPSDDRLERLAALTLRLERQDPGTYGHSRRVAEHAEATGRELGLDERSLAELRLAASLHDVGKVAIPAEILDKPGPLTRRELEIVRSHASFGAAMATGCAPEEVVSAIRHHHEDWAGSGYPDRLVGEEIPLFARVIAVCDAFDAMTSIRPYKRSVSRRWAVRELRRASGRRFDPHVVVAFLTGLSKAPALVAMGSMALDPRGRFRRLSAYLRRSPLRGLPGSTGAAAAAAALALLSIGNAAVAPRASASEKRTSVSETRANVSEVLPLEVAPSARGTTQRDITSSVLRPHADGGSDTSGRGLHRHRAHPDRHRHGRAQPHRHRPDTNTAGSGATVAPEAPVPGDEKHPEPKAAGKKDEGKKAKEEDGPEVESDRGDGKGSGDGAAGASHKKSKKPKSPEPKSKKPKSKPSKAKSKPSKATKASKQP